MSGKDALQIKNFKGEVIEQHTFDSIFNKTKVKIDGKYKELNFSVFAEMWLQNEGIRVGNIVPNIANKSIETCLKLVFAGLPPEEYRDKMSFVEFRKHLESNEEGKKEAGDIIERTDYIIACFLKHLMAVTEKVEVEKIMKMSDEEVKKNSLKTSTSSQSI
ncbi:hypothetical protein Emin_0945 [Elusimicrobium minutum Pei191]|uniref:Uncharacterized protein n=1 Tax=Elusimicrobium minutum (strain Pei191) TaxID=445932 RepID=B2KDA2_ELUMP|nr:hypothetical protein [Elusimicrobium minutum]ACC98498.1 hypothetical protein Emin_0945 [Elusimicrobium minutum Pei191]